MDYLKKENKKTLYIGVPSTEDIEDVYTKHILDNIIGNLREIGYILKRLEPLLKDYEDGKLNGGGGGGGDEDPGGGGSGRYPDRLVSAHSGDLSSGTLIEKLTTATGLYLENMGGAIKIHPWMSASPALAPLFSFINGYYAEFTPPEIDDGEVKFLAYSAGGMHWRSVESCIPICTAEPVVEQ